MDHLKTISIQKNIYLASVQSTNEYLTDYLSKNNPHNNLCVYTFNQTAGKGQIGRFWFSDCNKNLSVSYLFYFNKLSVADQFYLNMAVSLGLRNFLADILDSDTISIKWPNDIYIKNKKVAGILIQNQVQGSLITKSIIGIGLNINQDAFPSDLPNAISMTQHTGKSYVKTDILVHLHAFILDQLKTLTFNMKTLRENYLKHLYKINTSQEFVLLQNAEKFTGIIRGINDDGRLTIETNNFIKHFNFRELQFIHSDL